MVWSQRQQLLIGEDNSNMISAVIPVMITEPWQIPMTICAIDTLLSTAQTDVELVVVESAGKNFYSPERSKFKWVEGNKGSYSADWNAGADAASGEWLLHTGNDVFVRPGWDVALSECLDISDCAIATVLTTDIAHAVKPISRGGIGEGVYGPFMAFNSNQRLDAGNFPNSFSDTDLVMRMYGKGMRSYRNYKNVAHHLLGQTLNGAENAKNFENGRRRFMEIHGDNPSLMYRFLSEGGIV